MTALPVGWFPGDPPQPGTTNGSYDWTGDEMDADAPAELSLPAWDDVLDGPLYPAISFCARDDYCYQERVPGGVYCRHHSGDPSREAA